MMPANTLAGVVLLLWPVVCFLLFIWYKQYRAATLSYLLGILYLPSAQGIVLPVLPDLTRRTVPIIGLLFAGLLLNRLPWKDSKLDGATKFFFGLVVVGNFLRVFANLDPLRYGPLTIPPLLPQNVITFILTDWLLFVAPMYLGISLGSKPERLKEFVIVWLTVALPYMALAALEVRMAPQVNVWVYGYFQHSWIQMIREGGFRPIVFMEHGLEVALFTASSLILATLAKKRGWSVWGVPPWVLSTIFMVMLFLCKSFASILYGMLGFLLLQLAGPGITIRVVVVIAVLVLTQPLTRLLDWFPTKALVDFFMDIDPARAASMEFRFTNEDMMLHKAQERIMTGWGGFARYKAYSETGEELSVPDGAWIIHFASGGIPRFYGVFGMLVWPLFRAWSTYKLVPRSDAETFAALALLSAFLVVDLLPNGQFNQLSFVLAGVVIGQCQYFKESRRQSTGTSSSSVSATKQAPSL